MKFIWSQKFCYNNDKDKWSLSEVKILFKNEYWFILRTKFDETIHKYVKEKFWEQNEARRSFSKELG